MNKSLLILTSSMLLAALTACGGNNGTDPVSQATSTEEATSIDSILAPTNDVTSNVGYAAGRHVFHNYMAARTDYDSGMYTDFGEAFFPSFGHAKLLVVPVIFSDNASTAEELAANKESIRKIFFGAPEETTWPPPSLMTVPSAMP